MFIHQQTRKQPIHRKSLQCWRLTDIAATLFITIGLLSPLAFLLMACGETAQTTNHSTPSASKSTGTGKSARRTHLTIASTPTPILTPTPTPVDTQTIAQIDDLLTQQVNAQQFSGSVLIAQGNQILLAKGYSMSNWANQTPNTPDTGFFLGSVTKEFTAMAILLLQAQGKINVQNKLCAYIPACPPPWQAVSIHEVLIHTSGIPELDDSQLSDASPASWIASFDSAPLQFSPGDQFSYCSTCYQILAYVVQIVSGLPYTQFLQQMIFTPLHMDETSFDSSAYYAQSSAAIGYASWQASAEQLGWQLGPEWSFLDGSGLLYSTVEDIYRWDQALSTTTLASQQTLNQAFTPYVTANLFPGSQYGYGWFISQSPVQGHQLIWHDGVIDGFRNYNGRYVNDDITIVILSNLATIDVISIEHSVEQILFGASASN